MSVTEQLAKLLAAASPGPWGEEVFDQWMSSAPTEQAMKDARLAVLSPTLAQAVLAQHKALGGIVTGLVSDNHYCCHHARLGRDDHTEGCYVGAAREALKLAPLAVAMREER